MKKKGFWLRILAMVLVFGMSVVGCDNDSTNDNDSIVRVTVTGLEITGEVEVGFTSGFYGDTPSISSTMFETVIITNGTATAEFDFEWFGGLTGSGYVRFRTLGSEALYSKTPYDRSLRNISVSFGDLVNFYEWALLNPDHPDVQGF